MPSILTDSMPGIRVVDPHPAEPAGELFPATVSAAELRRDINAVLSSATGDVSARAQADQLGSKYEGMDDAGRLAWFSLLAKEYGPSEGRVQAAAQKVVAAVGVKEASRARLAMKEALRPPRVQLYMLFNSCSKGGFGNGAKFVTDLRKDLLRLIKQRRGVPPTPAGAADSDVASMVELEEMDAELKEVLASWFDIGFLTLQVVNWDSPARLLERLMSYQRVHQVGGWEQLKNRLGKDRRCYAFFHPIMPEEPLIFIEVALTDGIGTSIQAVLAPERELLNPKHADTALFYSINSTQSGLSGVKLGNFLIKRVVRELMKEFPSLRSPGCPVQCRLPQCATLNACPPSRPAASARSRRSPRSGSGCWTRWSCWTREACRRRPRRRRARRAMPTRCTTPSCTGRRSKRCSATAAGSSPPPRRPPPRLGPTRWRRSTRRRRGGCGGCWRVG
jgi:malonyl-CoA decarboxylase